MSSEARMIDGALASWKLQLARLDRFFPALTEEQLELEVAPGRNRLIYLWGHLTAVHDAMLPVLGIGEKLYPELHDMFLASPDRDVREIASGKSIRQMADHVHGTLWGAFNSWGPEEWLQKHESVSDEAFAKDPSRNRYTVVLNRSSHIAFHLGQAVLVRSRLQQ